MIQFKEITIEGFGSMINPYHIEFCDRGLFLIKGENGVGKTTGFSALYWVLYGKTLKPNSTITTWEHLRPKDYLGTKVILSLLRNGVPLTIVRCQDYKGDIIPGVKGANRLMVLQSEGKDLYPSKSKVELQEKVNQIMGLSPELFKASLVFGQKAKRLVEEDGPTKKKIFEEAFGIDYINKAKDKAYSKFKSYEAELIPLERKLFAQESVIKTKKEHLDSLMVQANNYAVNKDKKLKELKSELHTLKVKLTECLSDKEAYLLDIETTSKLTLKIKNLKGKFNQKTYSTLTSAVAKGATLIKEYEAGIVKHTGLLTTLEETGLCPFCNNPIKKEDIGEHKAEILVKINQYETALKEVKMAYSNQKIELSSLSSIAKKIELLEDKLNKLDNLRSEHINYSPEREKYLLEQIGAKKSQISKVRDEVINFGIEDVERELSRLENDTKVLAKENRKVKKKYQVYEWLYSKALSNAGLKAFIFNQMLNKLNVILERYSRQFGIRPYFMVDMNSARKDIISFVYIGEMPVSFSDLSGGQAQLANIMTAFATHDLVASNNFNILVLDEVFEGLSSTNREVVSEIISMKASKKQVFIITHMEDFKPTGAATLELTLQDGATRPLF